MIALYGHNGTGVQNAGNECQNSLSASGYVFLFPSAHLLLSVMPGDKRVGAPPE